MKRRGRYDAEQPQEVHHAGASSRVLVPYEVDLAALLLLARPIRMSNMRLTLTL
jgi:hypothetical protein